MTKGSIHQRDIIILNVNVPDNRASKQMNQILMELKVEIDKPVITVGDFNILLSTTDRTTKQIVSKDTEKLNNTKTQQDLIDIT